MKKNPADWPRKPKVLRECQPGMRVSLMVGDTGFARKVNVIVAWHWAGDHICVRPYGPKYSGYDHVTLDGDTPVDLVSDSHSLKS